MPAGCQLGVRRRTAARAECPRLACVVCVAARVWRLAMGACG